MKPEDFDLFATMVKQRSGLLLTRDKAYLLESRLLPVSRKYNLKSLEDMAQLIRSKRDEDMMADITEAMMTTESSFFRDQKPFAQFRDILLPQMLRTRASKRQLRIWSSATSSGQEAYTLAMICAEQADALQGWTVDIVGTDISGEMIESANSGTYSHFEVQRGLPIRMLIKHFEKLGPDKWQIKENLRQMVKFKQTNLLHDFGPIGVFDVVFCRNVLLYFDSPTRARVLNSISSVMAPDAALFVGASETVLDTSDKFKTKDGNQGIYTLSIG